MGLHASFMNEGWKKIQSHAGTKGRGPPGPLAGFAGNSPKGAEALGAATLKFLPYAVKNGVSSGEHLADHVPVYIRQATICAIAPEGEFFVVDPKQVQNGGVEIIIGGGIVGSFPGPFIALAVSSPGLHSRARHPSNKGAAIMIATIAALGERHAAEFSCPQEK